MRGYFGATDPLVESCINGLKARLVAAGLIKVGTPASVTDALLFGAIMALSGFDAANKLAGPGKNAVDSIARLQACSLVGQALDKLGIAPSPPPPPSPTPPPVTPEERRTQIEADVGFVPRLVGLGIAAAATAAGFLLL